ncbi:MAG: biotin--[acetyl-CoA-carboxylase] ligase [Spirochaetota bacterium]|nr:biotin--[acetyl-CoA-carboxylase] ligase [Spirochaetota bacterium]
MINIEEEILRLIMDADDYISGESVADRLSISRSAVWKHIRKMRREGFRIDANPRSGYRLVSCPDILKPVLIKNNLNTNLFGNDIVYYIKTESTNTIANNLAIDGAEEGTVVIAEEQTKGRGRLDRSWLSPAYKNILMSVIFRPNIEPLKVFNLTMLSSLSVVKAIESTTNIKAQIKWPNDVYIENKKVGGILTELNAEQDRINFAIVGIGLNVNFDSSRYSEIKDIATSISNVAGRPVSRISLLQSVLQELEESYKLLKAGKVDLIRRDWNKHSLVIGKPVRIISFDKIEEGIAESVDGDGCLILRDNMGKRKKILSGDVSLRLKE